MGDKRERACAAVAVPAGLADATAGYRWARDLVGEAGALVHRLHGRGDAPDLFLKHGSGPVAEDVTDEMVRLRWLTGRLPVPGLVWFACDGQAAWLLTEALPGRTAYQVMAAEPDQRGAVVDALADVLRRMHAVPVATCPFDSGHDLRLDRARARIAAGLVETEEFDDARQGWSAEQVWDAMTALLPLPPDAPVVTHGDFSLDNILVQDGAVVGCIDLGRVGRADRYQDLAILWNCLGEFDPALQRRLFARYGIGEPDARRLAFHLMLDEMFWPGGRPPGPVRRG